MLKIRPASYGRSDRSALSQWFWEVDRTLIALIFVLVGIGLIAVAAASPAAADRYSAPGTTLPELYFFWRQLGWIVLSLPLMVLVSMVPRPLLTRLCLAATAVGLVALALVPWLGSEVNGARRWLDLGVSRVQPSEFLKPVYTVALAFLFTRRWGFAARAGASGGLAALTAVLLMRQPDFGSTVIFLATWAALFALAGARMKLVVGLGVAGLVGIVLAYFLYDVATARIDAFLFGQGDSFQTDKAMATLTAGGLLGAGPGAGSLKFSVPEPHTDYIFSVIGEEFGLIACLAIAILYFMIVARVLVKLLDEDDAMAILASAGLALQFGLQAFINMAVNVQIAPSKGMTLPFISYGGSSMLALSLGMGLLLAFSRRNPYLNRSPYVVRWSGT
ncbi:FtsW/RodA/SpoVE family cell cycle protein [Sphingomicrobium astaxanthinifaciens]|uniref:FtsW/RodA/SpoVE family cell cycle protein n=1 Tax=Sphingomicrobium astaxanthinifaciens TaxID=1227949 RepID=UPI001FCA6F65|nr:FtsW/RodA/SpoVE family cell cycle protein [Sphingomicrobium astaxanthinifaciens]MCJ7421638.1 FtsW/RodA/SpoVE family cell cycle protein [Sphingomicrobium astaxanthinifaciens]